MRHHFTRALIAVLVASGTAATQADAQSEAVSGELGEYTARYEDDAWYDVSEWFDGNDYNPTDEAIGRLDEEVYSTLDAVASEDGDNDVDWDENDYGYYANNDEDDSWFYDYSRYGYSDWYDDDEIGGDGDLAAYDFSTQYYDYDTDGLYEAYATFRDADGDGTYEDMAYYTFEQTEQDTASTDAQQKERKQAAAQDQKRRRAEKVSLSGKVESTKEVKTPQGKNLVVRLKDTRTDQQLVVDLGPVDKLKSKPQQNEQITATGPVLEVGEYRVLLTQQATIDGKQVEINRGEREYTGTVAGMYSVQVGGEQHRLVELQREDGKALMVDLGPIDELQRHFTENAQLTVTGPAVRIKDRRLLMADSFTVDGETTVVNRQG